MKIILSKHQFHLNFLDFECNLRGVESYEGSYTKNIKITFLVILLINCLVVCIDKFTKRVVVYRGENAAYGFIKAILKEYKYCKNVMNKHFNKNLIMSEEEEPLFQQSNSCWICKTLLTMMKKKLDRDYFT